MKTKKNNLRVSNKTHFSKCGKTQTLYQLLLNIIRIQKIPEISVKVGDEIIIQKINESIKSDIICKKINKI